MRKSNKWMWVLVGGAIITIGTGISALAYTFDNYIANNSINNNRFDMMNRRGNGFGHMGGMMGSGNNLDYTLNNIPKEKLPEEEITKRVEKYIEYYDENLEIGDIFIYQDTDYYVSIEESNTGKGAMELLVNPYTGDIYPEYGPNMMWNEKYGMHGTRGYGMMGARTWNDYSENSKKIDREKAVELADEYVKNALSKEMGVENDGHEFYGYYTFYVKKDDETVGMLSVNAYSGDAWYHTWHGELEKVTSRH